MIGYIILLLVCANFVYADTPDYVGAYKGFNFTRKYFASRLVPIHPHPDINDDEDRQRLSFGILVSVTGAEVESSYYDTDDNDVEIASRNISYAWNHYNEVSRKASDFLEDLYLNIKLVTDVIDNCTDVRPKCNDEVEKRRIIGGKYIKPIELLLSIGDSASYFKDNVELIDHITRRSREIPYLLNNVYSKTYACFLKQLLETYTILRSISQRTIIHKEK